MLNNQLNQELSRLRRSLEHPKTDYKAVCERLRYLRRELQSVEPHHPCLQEISNIQKLVDILNKSTDPNIQALKNKNSSRRYQSKLPHYRNPQRFDSSAITRLRRRNQPRAEVYSSANFQTVEPKQNGRKAESVEQAQEYFKMLTNFPCKQKFIIRDPQAFQHNYSMLQAQLQALQFNSPVRSRLVQQQHQAYKSLEARVNQLEQKLSRVSVRYEPQQIEQRKRLNIFIKELEESQNEPQTERKFSDLEEIQNRIRVLREERRFLSRK